MKFFRHRQPGRRLAADGVLSPDDRTELIEGEIVDMAPIGSVHTQVVTLLTPRLIGAVGDRATVRTQLPVRLSMRSEPQPDVALVKTKPGGYRRAHPAPTTSCCSSLVLPNGLGTIATADLF